MKRIVQKITQAVIIFSFSLCTICMPFFATKTFAAEKVIPESDEAGVTVEVIGAAEAGKTGGKALFAGLTTGQIIAGVAIIGAVTGALISASGDDSSSSTAFH